MGLKSTSNNPNINKLNAVRILVSRFLYFCILVSRFLYLSLTIMLNPMLYYCIPGDVCIKTRDSYTFPYKVFQNAPLFKK